MTTGLCLYCQPIVTNTNISNVLSSSNTSVATTSPGQTYVTSLPGSTTSATTSTTAVPVTVTASSTITSSSVRVVTSTVPVQPTSSVQSTTTQSSSGGEVLSMIQQNSYLLLGALGLLGIVLFIAAKGRGRKPSPTLAKPATAKMVSSGIFCINCGNPLRGRYRVLW